MYLENRISFLLVGAMLMVGPAAGVERTPEAARHVASDAAAFESSKFPALDLQRIADEDAAQARKGEPGGWRFAIPETVDVRPGRDGDWRRAEDGSWSWRYGVNTPDAVHLNFGFSRFRLPPGAALSIVSGDGAATLGPYTDADNDAHGALWTPILRSRDAVIQLSVPARARASVELHLTRIGRGYRGFRGNEKLCKSGACNMDVACLAPDDPWQTPRRAVATYSTGGFRLCTGSLLNNTREDRRMLFVTASHCGVDPDNAASLVVYWNFDAPACRAPGSAESASEAILGPLDQTQSGAIFLAATPSPFDQKGDAPETRSDVALLELDDPPNPAFKLHWAGWDRDLPAASCAAPAEPGSAAGLCATMHHPRGDEKRITFSEQAPVVGDVMPDDFVGAVGVHWRVYWDPTPPILTGISPPPVAVPAAATESGSSGSPLYNDSQRLIGVLSGGPSFCGATGEDLSDFYGQLVHAWEGLGDPSTRVRDYLDPDATGATVMDGVDLDEFLIDGFEGE